MVGIPAGEKVPLLPPMVLLATARLVSTVTKYSVDALSDVAVTKDVVMVVRREETVLSEVVFFCVFKGNVKMEVSLAVMVLWTVSADIVSVGLAATAMALEQDG